MTSDDRNGFTMVEAIALVADRQALSRVQARGVMEILLAGEATSAQIGAFLMGLRLKGVEDEEVVGLVEAMRAASVKIRPQRDVMVDLCGTGGDGSNTFNISTATALLVAACGIAVAKHGNRSASSKCGSADVLEALGVRIDLAPERASKAIEDLGFAFLFAPHYHPAMKHVGGARRELKTRTVFNLLGPLTNPAGVTRQLLGVFDNEARPQLARVLHQLGSESVWVIHGAGGLDELTIAGSTQVTSCAPSGLNEFVVQPADAGLAEGSREELTGGDAAENAKIIEAVFAGEAGARRDVVVLNAAAALVVSGVYPDLPSGAQRAAAALDDGSARKLLGLLREFE
jgi:anthranilate phosphoribosyltransferase